MNKMNVLLLTLIFLSSIECQMTEEERERLLNKVVKPINPKQKIQTYNSVNMYWQTYTMNYDSSKIKEEIDKYKFPQRILLMK